VAKVEHFAAVALDEMGAVMADLRQREGISARAVEFAILCAARSGEVRGATWSEIDLEAAVWTVPARRMKAGREHRVPLSVAAITLLQSLPRFAGVDYVFTAPRGGQLSDMAMTAVMRRMGRSETVHGFRSTFRDWCGERTAYPRDLAEHALAHTISNAAEAAYRRQDALDRRRPMMAAWADFCATVTTKAAVVGIREKRGALA
jgi:integrase